MRTTGPTLTPASGSRVGGAGDPQFSQATAEVRGEHRVGAVPVGPQLQEVPDGRRRAPRAAARRPGRTVTSSPGGQGLGDHVDGLAAVRGAGDVGDHPARRARPRARVASRARCSACSCSTSAVGPPPARLRPAAQRAQPGAGHVGQDPGERARPPGRAGAVGLTTTARPTRVGRGAADATSAARCAAGSTATHAGRRRRPRSPVSSAVLPPGPAHRSSHGPAAAVARVSAQADQLRALVLHPGPALADRRESRPA